MLIGLEERKSGEKDFEGVKLSKIKQYHSKIYLGLILILIRSSSGPPGLQADSS